MKRVFLILFGVILLVVSAPLLIGGLAATIIGAGDDPKVDVRFGRVGSDGYAVVSDALEINWDFPLAERFDVNVGVRSASPETGVFLGFAQASSVDAYLSGVPYTLVYDIGGNARRGDVDVPGGRAPGPPVDQDFWLAQASGSDLQSIPVPGGHGSYRLVVMNVDGSRGVDATVYGSLTLPYLLPVGIGMLVVGMMLLVLALALLIWGIRSKPQPQPQPAPVGYASGPGAHPGTPAPHASPGLPTGVGPYPGAGPDQSGGPPGGGPYPGPGQYAGAPSGQGEPAGPPPAPPIHEPSGPVAPPPQPPAQPGPAAPERGEEGDRDL
jgi:hypothetical protein